MRSRPILPGMESFPSEIEDKFDQILKITRNIKFQDWSMHDLKKVLKSLKKGQSPDTMNFVNELLY